MLRAAPLAALLLAGCLGAPPGPSDAPRFVACPEGTSREAEGCLNWEAPVGWPPGGTRPRHACDPGAEDVPVQRLDGWPAAGTSPLQAARGIAAAFGAALDSPVPRFAAGPGNLTWMSWRTAKGTVSYDDAGAGQPVYSWSGAPPEGADLSDPQDVLRAVQRAAGVGDVDARAVEHRDPYPRGMREASVLVWWNGSVVRGLEGRLHLPEDGRGTILLEFRGLYRVPDGAVAFPAEEARARAEAYAACLWRERGEPAAVYGGPEATQVELAVSDGTLAHRVTVEGRLRAGEACGGYLVGETVDVDAQNGAIHGSWYEPQRGSWGSHDCP